MKYRIEAPSVMLGKTQRFTGNEVELSEEEAQKLKGAVKAIAPSTPQPLQLVKPSKDEDK